jgi:small neutral amino acid transporter SnatA (MarC family)
MNALTGLMGLLLAVIAVQFVIDGIREVLFSIIPPR